MVEPRRPYGRRDKVLPKVAKSITEIALPARVKERSDKLDPRAKQSMMLQLEPNRMAPTILTQLPKGRKVRMDNVLPKARKSITLTREPHRVVAIVLTMEPRRRLARSEIDEPMWA